MNGLPKVVIQKTHLNDLRRNGLKEATVTTCGKLIFDVIIEEISRRSFWGNILLS